MRTREEAAARCTKVIKRRVLKTKQARTSRAQHLVRSYMSTGTEDGEDGKQNFSGIVKRYTRIRKRQKKYWKKEQYFFKEKGDQKFTVDGRNAEITVDLVLQAKAKLSDKDACSLPARGRL